VYIEFCRFLFVFNNLYSILFTVCEVAFDNFFIKEFYDDDDDDDGPVLDRK